MGIAGKCAIEEKSQDHTCVRVHTCACVYKVGGEKKTAFTFTDFLFLLLLIFCFQVCMHSLTSHSGLAGVTPES